MNPRSQHRVAKLRAQVAARDHWICCRCHSPISRTPRWPDPESLSLEHLIPLAAGGEPYDPSNCGVSHLRCNLTAGAYQGLERHTKLKTSEDW